MNDYGSSGLSWSEKQKVYWNSIAHFYDTTYSNFWYHREDAGTLAALKAVIPERTVSVLELACGTGLGYSMCKQFIPDMKYIGLDLADNMLAGFRRNYPDRTYQLLLQSMSNLDELEPASFDAVICIYTSASFCDDPGRLVDAVYRLLRPNGCAFLSFVGRWSFRRLIHLKFSRIERFQTRGIRNPGFYVPAWVLSKRHILQIAKAAGFAQVNVSGQSIFGGIVQLPWLWPFDCYLSRLLPDLCHTLNLTANK